MLVQIYTLRLHVFFAFSLRLCVFAGTSHFDNLNIRFLAKPQSRKETQRRMYVASPLHPCASITATNALGSGSGLPQSKLLLTKQKCPAE